MVLRTAKIGEGKKREIQEKGMYRGEKERRPRRVLPTGTKSQRFDLNVPCIELFKEKGSRELTDTERRKRRRTGREQGKEGQRRNVRKLRCMKGPILKLRKGKKGRSARRLARGPNRGI